MLLYPAWLLHPVKMGGSYAINVGILFVTTIKYHEKSVGDLPSVTEK